ncbi:hypothetical protein FGO68_gene5354 [Halteria grandinella]|uniref:RING-type domain-containing protein n=1 Tax=Halteria grandinella TaxID=5974 RepID=A0A8J8SVG9_HALGN|nr:hypothetical protein FGO68_gene5354 [Halteria grandinella]
MGRQLESSFSVDVSDDFSDSDVNEAILQQSKYIAQVEAEACVICCQDFVEGDDISILNCKHPFHHDCARKWLKHQSICPVCRADVQMKN